MTGAIRAAGAAASSTERARQQLQDGIARGFEFPFSSQGIPVADRELRHSAVLILFGALDDVPADASRAPSGASRVPAELDVLLLRRSNGLRNHAGQIAFPGGGVEPGDADHIATALREAQEETRLDPTGVDVLGTLPDAHIPVSNYMVTPVMGWWRRPSEIAADESESVQVFRVPVAELLDPRNRRTSVLQRGPHTYRGPAFMLGERFGGHVLWGFTAMLLTGIFDTLGWAEPWDHERTIEIAAG